MKTYIFPIAFEETNDAWHVYVPGLESQGAATWGHTRDEALQNIQEVAQMLLEEFLENGDVLPQMIIVSDRASVAVSI